jgi:hypothetical protein
MVFFSEQKMSISLHERRHYEKSKNEFHAGGAICFFFFELEIQASKAKIFFRPSILVALIAIALNH